MTFVSIERQIEKYLRMEAERSAHYRRALGKNQMTQAVWAEKMAEIIAIRKSLEWLRDWRHVVVPAVLDAKRIEAIRKQQEHDLAEIEAADAEAAALAAQARAAGASVRITDNSEAA